MEEKKDGINVTINVTNSNATIAPVAKVAGQTIINVGSPDQVQDALITADELITVSRKNMDKRSLFIYIR